MPGSAKWKTTKRRDDEEEHRRQRVARPQLEQQVLARERADVADVAHVASASRPLASGSTRAGSWVETRNVRSAAKLGELRVEQLGARLVERAVRLVEHEQLRLVQEDAAEGEPLRHAARVRGDALVPRLPEPEALEQHPDPLAPLGHAVEPPVEVEVLERGQLAVDERLVAEEADRAARSRPTRASPAVGVREAGAEPQQRRLPGAVRAGDDQEPAAGQRRGRAARATRFSP